MSRRASWAPRMVMLLLLLACAPSEDSRDLSIVDDADTATADSAGGSSADSGGDTAADTAPDDDNYEQGLLCGDGDPADDPTGGDVVAAEWCSRVTPEAVFTDADTAATDTAGPVHTGAPAPPPPPCGFVNLVGGVAIASSPTAPLVLYCDSDPDGGTRAVHYEPGAGLRSTLLSSEDCTAEPASAALLPVSDGWYGMWATSAGTRDGSSSGGVMGVRLDADAQPLDAAEFVEGELTAWKLSVVPGDPALLLLLDVDGGLWSLAISEDAGRFGALKPVGEGTHAFASVRVGAEAWVASCPEAGPVTLTRLSAAGMPQGSATVDGSACAWTGAPVLASDGAGFALAWDDGEHGWVAWFDADGAELGRQDLGARANFPALTWTGESYLTLDATGALTGWSPTGEPLGSVWFAGVLDAPGAIAGLRIGVEAGALSFLVLGLDSYTLTSGHVNSFNYVEVGSLVVPGFGG